MHLPSLDYLIRNARSTLNRFPWVLAMAIAATLLACAMFDAPARAYWNNERLGHCLMAAILGISLMYGWTLFMERTRLRTAFRIPIFLASIAVLIVYALSMEGQPEFLQEARFALFLLASHLFAAVSPFLRRGYTRGFWEYNHRLFLRIIISVLFSGCLFAGLAAALTAVKFLFHAPIPDKAFFWLWAGIGGIFNTWFFLAGLPADLEEVEGEHAYPRILKVLTQYILIPLVTLYLIILYVYASKILVTREWPIGWVSYLVLICSLLGILSLLLIHPIEDMRENQWIRAYSRRFYLALFPLLILLSAAIGKRISEYRVTENRYFVVLMALWLTGMALYFTFSRVRNIKMVPLSLGALALLSSFGPWGAFQISRKSQVSRLKSLLVEHHLLQDGKLVRAVDPIDEKTEAGIGAVVEFLERRDGLSSVRSWVQDSALSNHPGILKDKNAFLAQMGLKYMLSDRYGNVVVLNTRNYSIASNVFQRISGFDYYFKGEFLQSLTKPFLIAPVPERCEAALPAGKRVLHLTVGGRPLMDFDLNPLLDSLAMAYTKSWNQDIPPEKMYLEKQAGGYTIAVQLNEVHLDLKHPGLTSLTAGIYVKLPKELPSKASADPH